MKIFDLPQMIHTIEENIQLGIEPDAATVNMLIQEGPKVIEEWVDSIEELEAEGDFIKARISQLKDRMDARYKSAERMRQALAGVLLQGFSGRIKTPLITVWVQHTEGKAPSLRVRR